MSQPAAFDYEAARWGADSVRPGEWSIAGYRLDEALRHLPVRGRVVEVGCGVGRFLHALGAARPELERVGMDVSRTALALLEERCPQVEVRLIEGAELPAAEGEFDAVLLMDVLEHVDDPEGLVAELRRVLRPGGVLHAHVPCEGDPRCLWRWLPGQAGERGLKRRFGGHVQRFRRAELLALLEAGGFGALRVRNSLHLLGNVVDLAAFLRLAAAARGAEAAPTTGDLISRGGVAVRAVDALLWLEARLLSRLPSWAVHVSARRL